MANPRDNKPVIHTKKHIARLERERKQTRIILFSFIGIVVLIIGLLVYGYLDVKYFQARRAVATVGNVSITTGEWQARVRMERGRLINQMATYQQYAQVFGLDTTQQVQQLASQLSDSTSLGQSILDRMINEELIRQEAAKRGITASPEEIDKAIQESYRYFANGTPTPTITPTQVIFPTLSADTLKIVTITPTPTQFLTPTTAPTATQDPLASPTVTPTFEPTFTPGPTATVTPTSTPAPTATPYTLQGFQDQYKKGVDSLVQLGLTSDQVRKLYQTNVLRDKLLAIIAADTPRTQEQVWARQILVKDEAAAKLVEDRLAKGEDFTAVAKEVSIDTGSAPKGGDLGWFGKGVMIPEFETAAFSQKVGEIGAPVKSQFGYHIIQVLAHTNVPLDENGYEQARQQAFLDWLKTLRDEYKVKTYDIWQAIVPTDPSIPLTSQ
ncbi:MAG: peptidylprolyl isomerase [Chloroflexi bacterium]|nr:peptidylprolyl isomerase [Chloroflexota bacterium]